MPERHWDITGSRLVLRGEPQKSRSWARQPLVHDPQACLPRVSVLSGRSVCGTQRWPPAGHSQGSVRPGRAVTWAPASRPAPSCICLHSYEPPLLLLWNQEIRSLSLWWGMEFGCSSRDTLAQVGPGGRLRPPSPRLPRLPLARTPALQLRPNPPRGSPWIQPGWLWGPLSGLPGTELFSYK